FNLARAEKVMTSVPPPSVRYTSRERLRQELYPNSAKSISLKEVVNNQPRTVEEST
ncbi:13025_t:CDS:2, partial [Acaulospora morrowiae]